MLAWDISSKGTQTLVARHISPRFFSTDVSLVQVRSNFDRLPPCRCSKHAHFGAGSSFQMSTTHFHASFSIRQIVTALPRNVKRLPFWSLHETWFVRMPQARSQSWARENWVGFHWMLTHVQCK